MKHQKYLLVVTLVLVCFTVLGCVMLPGQERASSLMTNESQITSVDAEVRLSLDGLADGMATVQYNLALGESFAAKDPKQMVEFFELVVLRHADALSVEIDIEELLNASTLDDGDDLFLHVASEIAKKYGSSTAELFGLSYYRHLGDGFLINVQHFLDDTQSVQYGIDWSQMYWRAFIQVANLAGVDQEIIQQGNNLLGELSSENIEELERLRLELNQWSWAAISSLEEESASVALIETVNPTPSIEQYIGDDIFVQLPLGDESRGKELIVEMGCIGCHVPDSVGTAWSRSTSTGDFRMLQQARRYWEADDYTGNAKTIEQYLLEAMIIPKAYTVPGYLEDVSPDYSEIITKQDAADIIAYLTTLD